jgi:predicted MFS family arabinose efflux permease
MRATTGDNMKIDNAAYLKTPPQTASRAYRKWFLLLLVLVYASSFIDRIIIAVVGQAIKAEMHLTDLQLGLLGGLAFSVFYTTLGIPMARLAERCSRVKLISLAIVGWSLMTALCGTASGFVQLLLFRLGVGVGEAGSTPVSHSLIADQFPPERRATALSIYALGPPIGVIFGALGGGWILQQYGWRAVFYVVGLPGLLFGLLAWTTLREPKRGGVDANPAAGSGEVPPLGDVVRTMRSSKAVVHLILGTVIGGFAQYGINLFIPVYLNRVFGMSFAQAGLVFGLIIGVGGILGNMLGGLSSDWASKHDRRWYAWVPALGTLVGFPLALVAFLQPQWPAAVGLLFASTVLLSVWHGPTFAVIQSVVAPRMRATASALVFLLMNFIGQGLGPAFIGFLSDRYAAHFFTGGNFQATCSTLAAKGHGASQAPAALDAALVRLCGEASATGVRYAMLSVTVVLAWSALHYFRAPRSLARK